MASGNSTSKRYEERPWRRGCVSHALSYHLKIQVVPTGFEPMPLQYQCNALTATQICWALVFLAGEREHLVSDL